MQQWIFFSEELLFLSIIWYCIKIMWVDSVVKLSEHNISVVTSFVISSVCVYWTTQEHNAIPDLGTVDTTCSSSSLPSLFLRLPLSSYFYLPSSFRKLKFHLMKSLLFLSTIKTGPIDICMQIMTFVSCMQWK